MITRTLTVYMKYAWGDISGRVSGAGQHGSVAFVGRSLQQQNCEKREGCVGEIGEIEGRRKHTGIGRNDLSFCAIMFSAECPTTVAATYSMSNNLAGRVSNTAPTSDTSDVQKCTNGDGLHVYESRRTAGDSLAHTANRRGIEIDGENLVDLGGVEQRSAEEETDGRTDFDERVICVVAVKAVREEGDDRADGGHVQYAQSVRRGCDSSSVGTTNSARRGASGSGVLPAVIEYSGKRDEDDLQKMITVIGCGRVGSARTYDEGAF
jgi:hypothetical protein